MNLTIMVPTKNRPNFISRQLKYYSASSFKGHIFIGDSSNQKLFNETKSNILKYGLNLNIQHFHIPKLTAAKATSFLSCKVTTDYSVSLADDDIIFTKSISKCLDFLNQNHDYVGVHGSTYLMELKGKEAKPIGKILKLMDYHLAIRTEDNSISRIEMYSEDIRNIDMIIIRSRENMVAFNLIDNLTDYFSSYVMGELVHGTVVASRGKIGKIDVSYGIRQNHTEQYYLTLNTSEWLSNKDWQDSCKFLKSIIEKEIMMNHKMEIDVVNDKSSVILSNFIKTYEVDSISSKKKLSVIEYIYKTLNEFFYPKYMTFIYKNKILFSKHDDDMRLYCSIVTKDLSIIS